MNIEQSRTSITNVLILRSNFQTNMAASVEKVLRKRQNWFQQSFVFCNINEEADVLVNVNRIMLHGAIYFKYFSRNKFILSKHILSEVLYYFCVHDHDISLNLALNTHKI